MTDSNSNAQYMISTPAPQLAQIDAIAIVLGVSRAEVARKMFDAMVPRMMRDNSVRIDRLTALAARKGMSLEAFVQDLREGRTTAQARSRRSMPTLEALEEAAAFREGSDASIS